jgi:peptide/nickel transport system substrate-binding protein
VTSADVKFTVDALLNPKNIIGSRSGFDQITAMRTPDAQTIVFELKRPDASALAAIEQQVPLPKHLLAAVDDLNHAAYNALPVSNGPYRVTAWRRGDDVRFEANDRYWRGRPKVPAIDVRIIPDAMTALLQFQTHEVDLLPVLPSQLSRLPATGINRAIAPTLAWAQIGFNFANPALADKRVRQAVMLAIDREKLATVVGHGLYTTERVMLPLFQWGLDPRVRLPAFDATAANRLLDAAGWTVGPDGTRRKGGQMLDLTMVYRAGGDGVLPATVAADLEQVHVHVEEKAVQASLLFNTAAAGGILATGKFDLALLSLQTNPDPDVSWLFACGQRAPVGFNFWQYCNRRLDADLEHQASTFDRARRARALASVQRELLADVAFVPLFRIDDLWASASWLHGLHPSPYGPFWNVYDWSIADP